MSNRILWTMARKNLWANRSLIWPFILSTSAIYSCFYILVSLLTNNFVLHRATSLSSLIRFGVVVVWILAAGFTLYANRFLNRQRQKEFALYAVLGLEQRHVGRMLLMEQFVIACVTSVWSVVGGYLFGSLSFMWLNRLMKSTGMSLMDYPFRIWVMNTVMISVFGSLLVAYLLNVYSINRIHPVELFQRSKKGEGVVQAKWVRAIIGMICLTIGYFLALSTDGLLDSLQYFYIAVLAVIAGTYLLFSALTTVVLHRLKAKRSFYYQTTHFIGISGLLHRVKSNAWSLATVSILCTSAIIAIGTTATLYSGLEKSINNLMPRQNELSWGIDLEVDINSDKDVLDQWDDNNRTIYEQIKAIDGVHDLVEQDTIVGAGVLTGNTLKPMEQNKPVSSDQYVYILVGSLDQFNRSNHLNEQLQDNEILIRSNAPKIIQFHTLKIQNKKYSVKRVSGDRFNDIAINAIELIFPNREAMIKAFDTFQLPTNEINHFDVGSLSHSLSFDGPNTKEFKQKMQSIINDQPIEWTTRQELLNSWYTLNGGFLFIGIIIGVVMLIGTVLVIYYRQISEGFEDRPSYQIMKKIGLSEELILKTARQQMFWVFLLPLFVAVIHLTVASKIIFNLLGIFGFRNLSLYILVYSISILVFVVVYIIVYLTTSKKYFRIVNAEAV